MTIPITPAPFLLLDGATGSNLMAAGLPSGVSVEQWVLEHPQVLEQLQQDFVRAGSKAVLAATFGANPQKLSNYGLAHQTQIYNRALVELSRRAVGEGAVVVGDVSPTGLFLAPMGTATFEDLLAVYRPQMAALKEGGVSLVMIETQMTLADARAALLCAKEQELAAFVTITVEQSGRTLSGLSLGSAVVILQAMGAHGVGLNCSCGPVSMKALLQEAAPYAKVPLIAKPNAGEPGNPLPPDEFGRAAAALTQAGATVLGGCCGTTPEHIRALAQELTHCQPADLPKKEGEFLADERNIYSLPADPETETIACSEDLMEDLMDADPDADLLILTLSAKEDCEYLTDALAFCRLPVCFSSHREDVLETALATYQGRAMITGQGATPRLQQKYGALLYIR